MNIYVYCPPVLTCALPTHEQDGKRRMEVATVRLPLRVLADSRGWSLARWLVTKGSQVYRNQRVAVLRSLITGAVDHALAPHSGTLSRTLLTEGAPVKVDSPSTPIAFVEFCPHSVVFNGLCAVCGEDVSAAHFADTPADHEARLPVAYNAKTLAVTRAEAQNAAAVTANNLFVHKKLSLVLDLDHTLVHATDDPRAAAILEHSPPNVDIDSIAAFSLRTTSASTNPKLPRQPPCKMHVKLRPHLKQFLTTVSAHFELHIYTMGSRPYADQVARLIDPDKSLFRGRITSREDFDEGRCNQKSISRLFPCDDSMVLIVDDREDVWINGTNQMFMPNLIRAKPYCFWDGLHEAYDRASSTSPYSNPTDAALQPLPEAGKSKPAASQTERPLGQQKDNSNLREDANRQSRGGTGQFSPEKQTEPQQLGAVGSRTPEAEGAVSSGRAFKQPSSANVDKSSCNSETPTLEATEMKDKGNGSFEMQFKTQMGNIVRDWWNADQQSDYSDHLLRLADILNQCHEQFFKRAEAAKLREKQSTNSHEEKLPESRRASFCSPANVKDVLADMRRRVFANCVFTFTGIFPLNAVPEQSPLWDLAVRHGARCQREYQSGVTTHVIASAVRGSTTEKTKRAIGDGSAFCVDLAWLEDSTIYLERRPELRYSLYPPYEKLPWQEYRKQVEAKHAERAIEAQGRRVPNMHNGIAAKDNIANGWTSQEGAISSEPPLKRLKESVDEPSGTVMRQQPQGRVLTGDEINDALDSALAGELG